MSPRIAIAVLASAALLAGALWLLARWRSRRLRRRLKKVGPRLRYPVVLAHGFMGFDQLELAGAKHPYFRGVEERLTRLGARVYGLRVRSMASVEARAEDLARAVRLLDAERVNVIAHSMGGLDARYALTRLGLVDKVASLVTVGTPHRGTPLADLATGGRLLGPAMKKLFEMLRLDRVDGFFDLTTARMDAFNGGVPNAAHVWYGSYVAVASGALKDTHPLLVPTWRVLRGCAGDNDGLVPTASQPWGDVMGTIHADHWAQIGWSSAFDAPAFYEAIVRELVGRGL